MNELAPGALSIALVGGLHALEARLDAALEPHGLSLAKFGVLARLAAAGEPLPLRTVAELSACVRSNITQLVDRLEAEKLVLRVDDPNDRRSVRAELTPAGRARYAAGLRALEKAERELLARVPGLEPLLRKLGSLRCQP